MGLCLPVKALQKQACQFLYLQIRQNWKVGTVIWLCTHLVIDSTQAESLGLISILGGLDLSPVLPMCQLFPSLECLTL